MFRTKVVVLVLLEPTWHESEYAGKSIPLVENHIDPSGFEIHMVGSHSGSRIMRRVSDNIYLIPFHPMGPYGLGLFTGYLLYLIGAFIKIVRIVPKIRAQVLLSFGGHAYMGLIVSLAGKLLRRKAVVRISEPTRYVVRSRYRFGSLISCSINIMERLTFSLCNVVVSNRDMAWYSSKIAMKQNLISQGVDLSLFRPGATPAFHSKAFPKLITVARLDKQKNIGGVIGAVRLLKDKYPEIMYYIVGSGPDEHYLRDRAARLGVNRHVRFCGYVNPEKVPGVLASCDVFVLPSFIEGLPSAALEAMACGLPVIMGSTRFGWKEWFIDGKNALLVKGNPPEIAKAINKLLSNTELRNNLVINGMKFVKEYHDSSKTKGQFTAIVRQLLKNTQRQVT